MGPRRKNQRNLLLNLCTNFYFLICDQKKVCVPKMPGRVGLGQSEGGGAAWTAYTLPWARWAGGQAVSRTSFPFSFPLFPLFPVRVSFARRKNRYVCLKRAGSQARMLKKSGREIFV